MTVIRPAEKEERGTIVHDWTNATPHTVGGCSLQASDTSQDYADRTEQSTTRAQLFAPPNADIRSGDRISAQFNGQAVTFEIDGEPLPHKSPTGRVDSLQASLIVWRG